MTYTRMAAALADRNLYGIFRENDPIRTYPTGALAGSIVGFVNTDGVGVEGLEYKLNTQLAGVEGQEQYESAPNGSKIPLGASKITPAQNGYDYQLTLDSELQWVAQRRVAQAVRSNKADFGFAITMNVKTGEILAMAQAPSYDATKPLKGQKYRNLQALTAPYEPGSVQKVLTAAALIDSGTVNESTRLEIPNRLTLRAVPDQGPLRARATTTAEHARGDRQVLQHRHGDAVSADADRRPARLPQDLRPGRPDRDRAAR